MDFQFGLKKRLYNYNMKLAREEKGLTLQQLADRVGCSVGQLGAIQSFRVYPNGDLQARLSATLEVPTDSLFPEDIKEFRITKSPGTVDDCTITLSEAKQLGMMYEPALLMEGWEDAIDKRIGLTETIENVLHSLNPREEEVLRDRFGLGDSEPMTLEDTGAKHKVTKERIRQIEAKALRKLRHPSKSMYLKDYIN